MPRQRIYTHEGYLEVQWDRTGNLVCVVSGLLDRNTSNYDEHMHQFTAEEYEDLKVLDVALHRATTKNRDANWAEKKSTDQIIEEYAGILNGIYSNNTVGDYTFEGVLADFLRHFQAKGRHRLPCVDGSLCGEAAHCPPDELD